MTHVELIKEFKKINGCTLQEFADSCLKNNIPEHTKVEFSVFNAASNGDMQIIYKGNFYAPAVASGTKEYIVVSFGERGIFDYNFDRTLSNEEIIADLKEKWDGLMRKKFTTLPNHWLVSVNYVAMGINGDYE